jgi:MoaA/NifB/PqqE/SkfB family radical SAM enzyme
LIEEETLDRKKELCKEKWLEIIDEGTKLGVEEWHICGGGEPLFFIEDAMAIMERIKSHGKYGELITNGTLFTRDVIERLVGWGWDKIYFSLDAPIPRIQDELRSGECYDKIIRAIKLFVRIKRKFRSPKPILCLHMVICNKNYKTIPQMVRLTHELGVQELLLNALNVWKEEIKLLELNDQQEQELIRVLQKSLRLTKFLGVNSNISEFLQDRLFKKANIMNQAMIEEVESRKGFDNIPCYYPWYNMSIFPNGMVQACFIPKQRGEFVTKKSLKEIWFGRYFEKVRAELLDHKLSEDCARCNPWNLAKMREIRKRVALKLRRN